MWYTYANKGRGDAPVMVLTTQQLTGQLKDTVLAKIVFSTTLVLEK